MREALVKTIGSDSMAEFWSTSVSTWNRSTPWIRVCKNADDAINVLAQTSVQASAVIDNNALVPSEWMCIEWSQELATVEADTQRLLDRVASTMDALSVDSGSIRLVGFPSRKDDGSLETLISMRGYDQLVRMTDRAWTEAIESNQRIQSSGTRVSTDKMSDKRVSMLMQKTLEAVESGGISARLPWIDRRLTRCPIKIDSWSAAVEAALIPEMDDYEWPLCVTRRTPVIVWRHGDRLRCLVKTRRIWRARNACIPNVCGVLLDNETWMHDQITDLSVRVFEWMRALFCGRPTTLRVKQMVDWSALSSETYRLARLQHLSPAGDVYDRASDLVCRIE